MAAFSPYRRQLLRALAAAPLATAAGSTSGAAQPGLIASRVCALAPELTPGPFYFDPRLDRSDVTEGRPGLPVDLAIQVVDQDCAPISGAVVELWHCDALGVYSGVGPARGETFLRGAQTAGADGVARFRTIYPGWYPGRTPHFHYKAHVGEGRVLTSQIFFPDAVSEAVYAALPPYADRGGRQDVTNANDRIALSAGDAAVAAVEQRGDGLTVSLVAGVAPPRS